MSDTGLGKSSFDTITIVPYREAWAAEYRDLVAGLRAAFPTGTRFHHIGSTSVPGLAAKDIIDIQATVASFDDIDLSVLSSLNYIERSGLSDHPPAGRDIPEAQLKKRFFRGLKRRANLHVRVGGAFNQRYPILCRDYLRAHPVTAESYQVIKERLSDWFPTDANRYYDIKDPVFDIIMDGAEIWAAATGWTVPEGDSGS